MPVSAGKEKGCKKPRQNGARGNAGGVAEGQKCMNLGVGKDWGSAREMDVCGRGGAG